MEYNKVPVMSNIK